MTKAERDSASRRKKAADPGQQQKSGAAKPTYVRTDAKKKMNEDKVLKTIAKELDGASKMHKGQANKIRKHIKDMKNEAVEDVKLGSKKNCGCGQDPCITYGKKKLTPAQKVDEACWKGYEKKGMKTMFGKRYPNCVKKKATRSEATDAQLKSQEKAVFELEKKEANTNRANAMKKRKKEITEGSDKKGKGSGTKDACYHKVKSRYSVWPSAYASGALVKCRKKGAANWGNSTKKEQVEDNRMAFQQFQEKCWAGYEKKGMKTMFGKRYPNCVKKKATRKEEVEQVIEKHDTPKNVKGIAKELDKAVEMHKSQAKRLRKAGVSEGAAWTKKSGKNKSGGLNEKGRKSYERDNPGSDLKAPSKKVGNPRRASFCARMKGMKKKLTSAKTARDPDSRINKSLRAWNCEYEPQGNMVEATRLKKEMGYDKGGTKKPTAPKQKDTALDLVKKSIIAKHGKGAIMTGGSKQQKKVKGAKSSVGTGKYKNMADTKKQTADDAKKRGFNNVQNYVDTMARYGGKDNYDKGRGLGT